MTELLLQLHWQRAEPDLRPGKLSNAHTVQFTSHGLRVDAAPDRGGDPRNTNPQQALASALSSCHMLTLLAPAAKSGWPVASYHDHAVAHLGKNPKGQMSVTHIDLHAVVRFDSGFTVQAAKLAEMQHRAHRSSGSRPRSSWFPRPPVAVARCFRGFVAGSMTNERLIYA